MSKVVNLNKTRKEKARDRSRREADTNAARYGQSKAQKELVKKRVEALRAKLDQHKVGRPKDDGEE